MKTSEKLDYLGSVELKGEGVLFDMFAALARREIGESNHTFVSDNESPEMKTTSIRMDEMLLASLDAVAKRFELSRNEAFEYAVDCFINDAINGYALGASHVNCNYKDFGTSDRLYDESVELIASLDCDTNIKNYITSITHNGLIKKMDEIDNK